VELDGGFEIFAGLVVLAAVEEDFGEGVAGTGTDGFVC
jgi:hypothetical protein